MEPEWGEALMRWSVRLAVAAIAARVATELFNRGTKGPWPRRWWTAGCVLYLLHVTAAFHFVHHWSHAAAYESTARQTREMTGVDWGGGLWLNDLFTALWCGDVLLWWTAPRVRQRIPRAGRHLYCGWFAFMVLNATIVFGPPFWKPVGVATALALGILLIRRRRQLRY